MSTTALIWIKNTIWLDVVPSARAFGYAAQPWLRPGSEIGMASVGGCRATLFNQALDQWPTDPGDVEYPIQPFVTIGVVDDQQIEVQDLENAVVLFDGLF